MTHKDMEASVNRESRTQFWLAFFPCPQLHGEVDKKGGWERQTRAIGWRDKGKEELEIGVREARSGCEEGRN